MRIIGVMLVVAVLGMAAFGLVDCYTNASDAGVCTNNEVQPFRVIATPSEFATTSESIPGGTIQLALPMVPAQIDAPGIWIWDSTMPDQWADGWGNVLHREFGDKPIGCNVVGPSDPIHPDWPPYCSVEALQLAIANGYAVAGSGTARIAKEPTGASVPPAALAPEVQPANPGTRWKAPFGVYLFGGVVIVLVLAFLPKIVTALNLTGTSHEVHTIKDPANAGDWQECGHQHGFLWGLFHWNGAQVDAKTPTGDVKGWSSAEKRWTVHLKGMGCAMLTGLVIGTILISILGR
jgi:hypothetical protein